MIIFIYFKLIEIHQAAKETVALAEQRFLSKQHEWQFDNAWQEMLNHATIKVIQINIKINLILNFKTKLYFYTGNGG